MKAPVKTHDWSALDKKFAEAAAAKGIKPGTMAWYAFELPITVDELPYEKRQDCVEKKDE